MYNLEMHANNLKVLRYYESLGVVDMAPLSIPGFQPNFPGYVAAFFDEKRTHKRQNELISYDDCLYRNMNAYEYLVVIDLDEVIMPRGKLLYWKDIINSIKSNDSLKSKYERGSYSFRHAYVLTSNPINESPGHTDSSVPRYSPMFRKTHRSANYTQPGHYVKCFIRPDLVLTIFNHFPLTCLKGNCHSLNVDLQTAHLLHYRTDCVSELRPFCAKYRKYITQDNSISRYKDPVLGRIANTLAKLGYFDTKIFNLSP